MQALCVDVAVAVAVAVASSFNYLPIQACPQKLPTTTTNDHHVNSLRLRISSQPVFRASTVGNISPKCILRASPKKKNTLSHFGSVKRLGNGTEWNGSRRNVCVNYRKIGGLHRQQPSTMPTTTTTTTATLSHIIPWQLLSILFYGLLKIWIFFIWNFLTLCHAMWQIFKVIWKAVLEPFGN